MPEAHPGIINKPKPVTPDVRLVRAVQRIEDQERELASIRAELEAVADEVRQWKHEIVGSRMGVNA